MRKLILSVAAFAAAASLIGCDSVKESLGRGKRSPDEFAVYQRAPLSVPPNFALRPPATGPESGLNPANDPSVSARNAMIGAGAATPVAVPATPAAPVGSPGIQALLKSTGGLTADPTIRQTVNRETTIMADEEKSFADKIMFWQKPQEPDGTIIDPAVEARRIQDNQALGKPITDGQTPTIERKQKGLLEGLF
jgi:hypothetical protein